MRKHYRGVVRGRRSRNSRVRSMRVRLGSRVLLLRNLVLCFRSSIVGCNAELVSSLKGICPKLRSRPFSRN